MAKKELIINGKGEKEFLLSYYHDFNSVSEIDLEWSDLVDIYNYYLSLQDDFNMLAQRVFLVLKNIKGAYIVNYRVKDPEHVIDKIIRKKIQFDKTITKDNLLEEIDDFVGLRILHLFKNDWEDIYKSLNQKFAPHEQPVAYYRKGDDDEYLNKCKSLGLTIKEKDMGYRSIHYIAKVPVLNTVFKCEIQIRTVFEEAWSEIDHIVRYPNNTDNELLNRFLFLFNAHAGFADEMGSFLIAMKKNISQLQEEKENLDSVIKNLRAEIKDLKWSNGEQKKKIEDLMSKLDKGVEKWQPNTIVNNTSTVDYWSNIIAPSGSTVSNMGLVGGQIGSAFGNTLSGLQFKDKYGFVEGALGTGLKVGINDILQKGDNKK